MKKVGYIIAMAKIIKLVRNNPNDSELGSKVRELVNKLTTHA